jgi:hypothetical protein
MQRQEQFQLETRRTPPALPGDTGFAVMPRQRPELTLVIIGVKAVLCYFFFWGSPQTLD